jgi:uncharacterized membrane protein YphA (DoxX/SURF4 family)
MIFELTQYSNLAFFVLRLAIAAIFIYHALPKLKNSGQMGQAMGWSAGNVLTLGLVEFVSSLGMISGLYIQIAAFLLALVMIGAIYLKIAKWKVPFSAMDKMGWEFDLILLAANIFILVNGGGALGLQ